MSHFLFKWFPILLFALLMSGSYFYTLYSPWSSHWLDGKEFWYKLYWKGEKVGYVQVNYDLLQDNLFQDKILQISQITRVNTTNLRQAVLFTEKEVFQFEAKDSGQLVSIFYHRQQDDYIEQTQLNKIDGYLQGERIIDNKKIPVSLKSENYQLSEFLQLMRHTGEQPANGDTFVARRFDLGELALKPVTYEFINNDSADGYLVKFNEQGRSWDGLVALSSEGVPRRFSIGQMVEQELSSKAEALSDNSQADYYQSQVISIDKPLGEVNRLDSLILTTSSLSGLDIINDQRQSIDSNGDLHIRRSASAKAATDDELQQYSKNLQVNEPLAILAKAVIGKSERVDEKVQKLLTFVSSYLKDTPVIRPMTVATILEQRKGDCTEHTQLFIALARAVDIPAREVRGLVYLGDDIQGFGGHVWSEVSIDNSWVAVDPTWNLQVLSATHIQLQAENDSNIFNGMHKDLKLSFSLKGAKYRY